ncbi:hypothetical protein EJ08DRAFT_708529 [Tothia fuscella]|uniref:Zn(2)-C6 fungal-type domain-containing protein n=1 Tax=Tothia fuscella TaxID=1048955 RepID=A0A9P4NXW3_9PEZI|nr:hypothetical protein EJ08DRAFT_708529 [Tothia fuscella]
METSHIRACTNCVRAKARCSPSTSANAERKCDRCLRMKKTCQPSPPMRRPAHRVIKKSSTNNTSQLEDKLDSLISLLKMNESTTSSRAGYEVPTNSLPLSDPERSSSNLTASVTLGSVSFNATPVSTVNSPSRLDPALEPAAQEAEIYLARFRTDFVKHFPFIVLLPSISAHQLRQERPLLWIAIMTVASSNSTQQITLSKELRGIFAREALVEGTRNMDLLLSILVYTVWDRRFHFSKPILICLVQLAIAVLYDLGLDKPLSKDPALSLLHDLKGTMKPARLYRSPTMEERRALLGCYMLSSVKGTCIRWTAFASECLNMVETEKEFESDALLIQWVKLRRIAESVNSASEAEIVNKAPVVFYLRSLESQLHEFKKNIPLGLAENKTLLTELYTIELSIYEIGLSQTPGVFSDQSSRRMECLWAYFNAIKSWIGVFLSIPPAQYVGFSAPIYSNMTHFFMAVYRLAIFEHPEWDRSLLREHLDISGLLDKAKKNFARVKEEAGLDAGGSRDIDSFTAMATKFEAMKMSWDVISTTTSGSNPAVLNTEVYDFPMGFADEDWLRDWPLE